MDYLNWQATVSPALQDVISGKYLDVNTNPHLQGVIGSLEDIANRNFTRTLPSIQAQFAASGRYGSGASAAQQALAQAEYLQNLGAQTGGLLSQSYESERDRMMQALGLQSQQTIAGRGNIVSDLASQRSAAASRYGADQSRIASMYGADRSLDAARAAAAASRYGSDQRRIASMYGSDKSLAAAHAAAAASRYGADQRRLASMFGSRMSAGASRYASDRSAGAAAAQLAFNRDKWADQYGLSQFDRALQLDQAMRQAQMQDLAMLGMASDIMMGPGRAFGTQYGNQSGAGVNAGLYGLVGGIGGGLGGWGTFGGGGGRSNYSSYGSGRA